MSDACNPMDCSMPGFPVHHQLLELAQPHVHQVSDAIQPSHPLFPPLLLPPIFPSIGVFSNESALPIRWSKYWSFSISPFHEYSGLISFRINWLDLLAVQGTLKSLLQHHSSKSSILQCSAFMVQLSHPYMTRGKNHSFDYTDLCQQSNVSAFLYTVYVCHCFSSKEQASFNFMTAVTIHSDSGAQENSLSLFSLFLHVFAINGAGCHDLHFFEGWVLSQLIQSPLSPSSSRSLVPNMNSTHFPAVIFSLVKYSLQCLPSLLDYKLHEGKIQTFFVTSLFLCILAKWLAQRKGL